MKEDMASLASDAEKWRKFRAYQKAYYQRPEVKARRKAYLKEYRQRPEVKKKRSAYYRAWYLRTNRYRPIAKSSQGEKS